MPFRPGSLKFGRWGGWTPFLSLPSYRLVAGSSSWSANDGAPFLVIPKDRPCLGGSLARQALLCPVHRWYDMWGVHAAQHWASMMCQALCWVPGGEAVTLTHFAGMELMVKEILPCTRARAGLGVQGAVGTEEARGCPCITGGHYVGTPRSDWTLSSQILLMDFRECRWGSNWTHLPGTGQSVSPSLNPSRSPAGSGVSVCVCVCSSVSFFPAREPQKKPTAPQALLPPLICVTICPDRVCTFCTHDWSPALPKETQPANPRSGKKKALLMVPDILGS